MKQFAVLICILILSTFFQSCSAYKGVSKECQREWKLVQYKSYTKEFLMSNNAGLDLSRTVDEDDRYSAFMGCNTINTEVRTSGSEKICFKSIKTTKKTCPDMSLEENFVTDLRSINRYEVMGHFMTLKKDDAVLMKFVAADWD